MKKTVKKHKPGSKKSFPRCIVSAPGTMVESAIIEILQKHPGAAVLCPYLYEYKTEAFKMIAVWEVTDTLIKQLHRKKFICTNGTRTLVYGYKRKKRYGTGQILNLIVVIKNTMLLEPT